MELSFYKGVSIYLSVCLSVCYVMFIEWVTVFYRHIKIRAEGDKTRARINSITDFWNLLIFIEKNSSKFSMF